MTLFEDFTLGQGFRFALLNENRKGVCLPAFRRQKE